MNRDILHLGMKKCKSITRTYRGNKMRQESKKETGKNITYDNGDNDDVKDSLRVKLKCSRRKAATWLTK